MKIGFITCEGLSKYFPSKSNPLVSHDDQVLADYLKEHNFSPEPVVWGTPVALLQAHGPHVLLMRSPWDYMDSILQCERFISWLHEIDAASGLTMINDPSLMLWNLNKRYLADLKACGISTIPTTYCSPDDPVDLSQMIEENGAMVVKPAISAAAKDTHRLLTIEDASNFDFSRLRQNRTFLIQPFLEEIMTEGEWSLVYIDGIYSHAVWKRPARGQWLVQDELGGSVTSAEPKPALISLADEALNKLSNAFEKNTCQTFVKPLYARVDIINATSGPMVGELELVEPELFFLSRGEWCMPNTRALTLFHEGLVRRLKELI